MKKKLFLALLTTLLLLLAASTALAASPSDYTCIECGNPCDEWFPVIDGGSMHHAPKCSSCKIAMYDAQELCTPADGTATCMAPPMCIVCSHRITMGYEPDPDAHLVGDWYSINGTQHYRSCQVCSQYTEYGDHTGGTATCVDLAICEVCDSGYGDYSDVHGEYSGWGYLDTQHYRYCLDCGGGVEYGDHTGGDDSCIPVCDDCSCQYLDVNGQHNNMFDWQPYSDTQHYRYCLDCGGGAEYGDHTGGTATCAYGPICEVCEEEYGEPLSTHNGPFWEWTNATIDQHWRKCETCGEYEYGDHTGGAATCAAAAVCDVCHEEYGFTSSTHTGNLSYEYLAMTHHYMTCDVCNLTSAKPHTGGTATCESGPICDLCETAYGESLGGHDYVAVVTKPTCTKQGYTTYTCSLCEDSYQADQTAARGHWYDLWYPNQDGTHSAECKRYGCNYVGTTECTLFEITVKDGENAVILTVCPVCGDHGDAPFAVVDGAAIRPVYRSDALPYGELIVRGQAAPFDGVLYAFTAAYESAGRVMPFKDKVEITLPLDAEQYATFKLVRADVTPATETAGRAETWTDVPFTHEGGQLTFETYTAGLFLLIPKQ